MPVTSFTSDPEALTTTMVAEFAAPVERLWQVFTDPRQLERFWGPPTWPSTFTEFDLRPGGRAAYRMTGPEGETSSGYWEFVRIEEPRLLEMLDGFADDDGNPNPEMPSMRMTYEFAATPGGSRLTGVTYFPDHESLERLVAMGMVEGATQAMNQLDIVVHQLREWVAGRHAELEILDERTVRITRIIDGPAELVWRAHTEPDLMRRWLLGPDGWVMTSCAFSTEVGGAFHYSWAPEDGHDGTPFGFEGEVRLAEPGRRLVTTEQMQGMDGPPSVNDLSLYEEDGSTLLTFVIVYPDTESRDAVIATGMVEGMEASYARLEALAPA